MGGIKILTPAQQAKAPKAAAAVVEGGKQQRVEIQRLHQEPEEISHHTVVTEDHRSLTGSLRGKRWREGERKNGRVMEG